MEPSLAASTNTIRLTLNAKSFAASPLNSIKQILGQNATVLKYSVNSIITWDNNVYVDVEYKTIPIDQFSIYYVPINEIKHLIPNSEKYVATVNGCSVKLNNPKLTQFKEYLPIRIKKTIINDTNAYDNYYSAIENPNLGQLKTSISSPPAAYFGTTVTNPLNALITPLSTISSDPSLTAPFIGPQLPPILYPNDFKPKSAYDVAATLQQYKQTLTNTKLLSMVDNIEDKTGSQFDFTQLPSLTTTAYLISASQLSKANCSINGIIMIQPKRQYDLILYYPTNAYTISTAEIQSILQFIESERINYCNYQWLKNK